MDVTTWLFRSTSEIPYDSRRITWTGSSASGYIVGLELAAVIVSLDPALGAVARPELVEGRDHLRASQVAVGTRNE